MGFCQKTTDEEFIEKMTCLVKCYHDHKIKPDSNKPFELKRIDIEMMLLLELEKLYILDLGLVP